MMHVSGSSGCNINYPQVLEKLQTNKGVEHPQYNAKTHRLTFQFRSDKITIPIQLMCAHIGTVEQLQLEINLQLATLDFFHKIGNQDIKPVIPFSVIDIAGDQLKIEVPQLVNPKRVPFYLLSVESQREDERVYDFSTGKIDLDKIENRIRLLANRSGVTTLSTNENPTRGQLQLSFIRL